MRRTGVLVLFVLFFSTQTLAGGRGRGFIPNFKAKLTTNSWYLQGQSLFLVVAFISCISSSCGVHNLGLFGEGPARQAERLADAMAEVQFSIDGSGDIVTSHVHVIRSDGRSLIAEVLSGEEDMLTVRDYTTHDSLDIHREELSGYLIDDHPHVGREVRLPSDQVGIHYLRGKVVSVYTDHFHTVFIRDKVGYDGEVEKLERDFIYRVKYVHEVNLNLDGK